MTWYTVPEYCNWMSECDGLPPREWCYKPLVDARALAAGSVGLLAAPLGSLTALSTDSELRGRMKLAPNYLQLTGYRLPTEAEWECACRAGAVTIRYYGDSIELLEKYAWYVRNSDYHTWPVGSLKPNDWGLFDMHGNVWNWCHEEGEEILEPNLHPIRGGAFLDAPPDVRAACRIRVVAERETSETGLRLARSIR
jgi:hypothetical protein